MNGIGQGSFAAALASSISIGTAVYDITKGVASANMGNMSAEKSRPDCIKDAELNPILMADHELENSASEKILGRKD